MRGVDSAAGALGMSVGELRGKVTQFSEALGELGAVSTGEVLTSMSKLLTETGSYEEASARATLAMKYHIGTQYSYEEALTIVDKAMRGQVRGIQQLTGEMVTGTTAHEKAINAVAMLEAHAKTLKTAIDDEAGSLQRSHASWQNFRSEEHTSELQS